MMISNDTGEDNRNKIERVLSGGADSSKRGSGSGSGRRGRINGGNSPRHRMPPKRHTNSSGSNDNNNNSTKIDTGTASGTGTGTGTGSGGKIPHGNGNGTAGTNITDPSADESYGWTLLSAGGCHYLDDGR